MAAETVDTYTMTPPARSVFTPENLDPKTHVVVPTPAKSTGEPIKMKQVSTKSK